MGVEVKRDRLSPMVRQAADPARAHFQKSLPETSARRMAYAIAMFRISALEVLATMPNAEGYAILCNEMQRLAELYQQIGQTLPSTNEH